MAISSVKEIKSARRIGMSWMIFSVVGAMFTGLIGIAYYSDKGLKLSNPETIFLNWEKFYSTRLLLDFY